MAIVKTDSQNYTDIAAAIRVKLNVETTYKPAQMAAAILAIGGRCPHADVLGTYILGDLPMIWGPTATEQE